VNEQDIRVGQTWEAVDPPGCTYRGLLTVTGEDAAGWITGIYKQQYRSASPWWQDCVRSGAPRRTRLKPGSLRERYRLLFDADFDGDRNLRDGDVYAAVGEALAQLDGTAEAAVSLLTGIPRDHLDELGGCPNE
jgi:hypothetical protein